MNFKNFRDAIRKNFEEMSKDQSYLFEVEVDKDDFWNHYLNSYPNGTNPIYRKRTEHDCSCCRSFIKNVGNVVAIKDNKLRTIWDINTDDSTYQTVANAMDKYIRERAVTNVFVAREPKFGIFCNFEKTETGDVIDYDHFYVELPQRYTVNRGGSVEETKGQHRDTKNVFKRSLSEITQESVLTVLELITSNTLYKGNEWHNALSQFLRYKKDFDKITDERKRDLFAWENSIEAGAFVGRIRNHSIGTLLTNISNGMDLDTAVTKYETIVAPSNYKRPKAIFTKRMLDEAKNTLTELGYMDSLPRRFATLGDITVNNILFSNKDSAKRISGVEDVFNEMSKEVSSKPKKFSKLEEITANEFVDKILPRTKELEIYLENKHIENMVSLIAPVNKDSKTMFKWNNNYSWSYTGNMTDSLMKERVKTAGGKIDGDLRFSIQWNDINTGSDNNDLDAHCITPNGFEIFYCAKRDPRTKGELDIDVITPENEVAVENITWANRNTMTEGTYKFFVHQYTNRGGRDGFRAEIEFDGQIYSFDYRNELRQNEKVYVAEVTYKNGQFSIKELLPSTVSSKKVWGVSTNQFIPVSVVCYSPNYWDEQNGIGNKHLLFMLKDCINPESPNGFFNEFLKEDLMKHKRVFEALGSKMKVTDNEDQLSGVGFCLSKRNELVVKVKGNVERVFKVKF